MNLRTKIGVVAVLLSTLTVQAQNIPFRKAEIKETMKKVADWQIANPNKGAEHGDLSWTNAVLYVGMLDWAELAEREDGNKDYFRFLSVRLNRLKNRLLANYLRNRGNDLATVRNSAFCVAILSNNSFICKYNIFFRKYELSVAIL